MADGVIDSLGGAGAYLFLKLKHDRKKLSLFRSRPNIGAINNSIPAGAVIYLSYDRCSPPSQEIHDTTAKLLSSNRRILSYKDCPRLNGLVETDNLLLLDNFALILIEDVLKRSSAKAISIQQTPR